MKDDTRFISKRKRYKVMKRQGWTCNICGAPIRFDKNSSYHGEVGHIDHIYPYSKRHLYDGDINWIGNLEGLCFSCNSKKRDKIYESKKQARNNILGDKKNGNK